MRRSNEHVSDSSDSSNFYCTICSIDHVTGCSVEIDNTEAADQC